jgi:hypothetical protein
VKIFFLYKRGLTSGSARCGIHSVVRLQEAVCQVVILKVISFDNGRDVAPAVGGRFLSLQRPGMNIRSYHVRFVLMVTGFTVSAIISHCSCVVYRIGFRRIVKVKGKAIPL